MITTAQQLLWLYFCWVALSSAVLWLLARSFAPRPLHYGVLSVAAIVTMICVALVVYAFTVGGGPPNSPIRIFLNGRGAPLWLASFLIWPFIACAAVAQISNRLSVALRATRWLSFGCGTVIAMLCPFALLAAGCGLAGACF